MIRIGAPCASIARICTGEVWVRSTRGSSPGVARLEVEGVLHRPRRMVLGHVERGEIIPLGLDLRPFGDGEAEVGENLRELVHHLADRVDRALTALRRRAATGRCVSVASLRSSSAASSAALRSAMRVGDRFAQRMDLRRLGGAGLGVHRPQRLQLRGDLARLAEQPTRAAPRAPARSGAAAIRSRSSRRPCAGL